MTLFNGGQDISSMILIILFDWTLYTWKLYNVLCENFDMRRNGLLALILAICPVHAHLFVYDILKTKIVSLQEKSPRFNAFTKLFQKCS